MNRENLAASWAWAIVLGVIAGIIAFMLITHKPNGSIKDDKEKGINIFTVPEGEKYVSLQLSGKRIYMVTRPRKEGELPEQYSFRSFDGGELSYRPHFIIRELP